MAEWLDDLICDYLESGIVQSWVLRDRITKAIKERMPKNKHECGSCDLTDNERCEINGYNQALNDVLKALEVE